MNTAASQNHSLGVRLGWINQITLLTAVTIIALVVITSSFFTGLVNLVDTSKSTAKVLAENTSAILLFEDVQTAEDLLSSLSHAANVKAVAIYREDLQPFARFVTGTQAIPAALPFFGESESYGINQIEVVEPIIHDGQTLGMLYLLVSLNALYLQVVVQLLITTAAVLCALYIARRMSSRLSNAALEPLQQLTSLMESVSNDANLQLRAPASDISELDTLARGFNGMLEQIQERDAHLAAHRERLEDEVAIRTAQLREARDASEASSRAKSEFLATMSHEIRTPMNGVLGMTELLLYGKLSDEQRRFAQSVQNSGRQLLGIINSILDFSKIESGHIELEAVDFSLNELVEDTLDMFAQQADEKGLELVGRISPPNLAYMLRGDPFRLRQVLTNLIGNAVKFTAEGEIVVHALIEETPEGVQLSLRVEDTGIGIPPESLLKIFDHFAQADGSTTRQYGGTGLGLAICKRLVELMGGNIAVESAVGQGSKFLVQLPLPKGVGSKPSVAIKELKQVRVIVVDDNATNLEILYEQLSGWGMRVACATTGARALQMMAQAIVEHDPFSLAILDMHMPQMDGLQLALSIRSHPDLATTRMIMLTSTFAAGSALERERAGILRFVHKPIRQNELLEVILGVMTDMLSPESNLLASAQTQRRAAPITHVVASQTPVFAGHVLLAEDNPVNQRVAIGMLARLGITTTSVNNGIEALAMIETQQYDLVLMDCQMPVMDGFQATAAIRQRLAGSSKHLPIIALTANSLEGDRDVCIAAGMDDYLSKPYSLVQLDSMIRCWLPQLAVSNTPCEVREPQQARASALNPKLVQQLREIDPKGEAGLLKEVMQVYLDSSAALVPQTEQAVMAADADTLRRLAHSLKSSSANVGADALSDLFRRLEIFGREKKIEQALPLVADLRKAYRDVTTEIRLLLLEEACS